MLARIIIAAAIVFAAALAAWVLRRRTTGADAPTQPSHMVPTQLDRADFARPDATWLVALFSSASCATCADVRAKIEVLRSTDVAVDDIEYTARRDTHAKYRIDGVPCVVVADAQGVVRSSFLGPVTATDLWAAVAEVREPGSSPEPGLGRAAPSSTDSSEVDAGG
jgi:hypothetical protein